MHLNFDVCTQQTIYFLSCLQSEFIEAILQFLYNHFNYCVLSEMISRLFLFLFLTFVFADAKPQNRNYRISRSESSSLRLLLSGNIAKSINQVSDWAFNWNLIGYIGTMNTTINGVSHSVPITVVPLNISSNIVNLVQNFGGNFLGTLDYSSGDVRDLNTNTLGSIDMLRSTSLVNHAAEYSKGELTVTLNVEPIDYDVTAIKANNGLVTFVDNGNAHVLPPITASFKYHRAGANAHHHLLTTYQFNFINGLLVSESSLTYRKAK